LKDQYLVSQINLKHQEDGTLVADIIVKFQGDGTSIRSRLMYKSATEFRNNIFLNVNIVSLKQDNDSSSNDNLHLAANENESDDDESILHDQVICHKAKNMLLSISAILELTHTSDKGIIPYSLEAALLCSAQIRFHTSEKEYTCEYDIFCECCGKNIYKIECHSLSMAQAMTILPDAIFCHKFWAVLGDKEIKLYLFDRHFKVKDIKKCTEAMPNRDNQNDYCIGNNQQILDALSPHKRYEDCMKDMFDIMDAFFTLP
jgi:hypothetical protein